MTEQIKQLSINFQKKNYPFETDAQKNERQKLIDEQGGWGIVTIDSGSGTTENIIEIPTAPQTKKWFNNQYFINSWNSWFSS